jgi:hypothetical protein
MGGGRVTKRRECDQEADREAGAGRKALLEEKRKSPLH